ncbi:uncharacterized protein KRP23_5562 [Phytophthora ramorum]|uniref:uncharacterized protein n=1 Tax=Phytophthora ramorum TaxID=164328 RepID=UPI0030A4D3ED|nr:hypothetical protein KRP23_5562 [Phytophthora ramorum]KAH7505739.1 hypothetical protein KRP22_3711 [Phytophthora ramorum]
MEEGTATAKRRLRSHQKQFLLGTRKCYVDTSPVCQQLTHVLLLVAANERNQDNVLIFALVLVDGAHLDRMDPVRSTGTTECTNGGQVLLNQRNLRAERRDNSDLISRHRPQHQEFHQPCNYPSLNNVLHASTPATAHLHSAWAFHRHFPHRVRVQEHDALVVSKYLNGPHELLPEGVLPLPS